MSDLTPLDSLGCAYVMVGEQRYASGFVAALVPDHRTSDFYKLVDACGNSPTVFAAYLDQVPHLPVAIAPTLSEALRALAIRVDTPGTHPDWAFQLLIEALDHACSGGNAAGWPAHYYKLWAEYTQ